MDAIETISTGRVLEVRVTGKLTKDAYQKLVPAVDAQIKEYGKLRILFVMEDFHGWTAGAMWEDLKFDLKHWKDIERLAIVGDKKWEKGMASFCKPFTKATIRYFDAAELDEAREWVASDAVVAK
jgi:SpoIIAA-like